MKRIMTDAEYVHYKGAMCPVCYNTEVNIDDKQSEDDHVYHYISCSECGANWTDTYKLIGYSDLCDGTGKRLQ